MTPERQFRRLCVVLLLLAAACVAYITVRFPPELDLAWVVALGTLLVLAVLSAYLALTINEGGTSTAVDFLAHLAAVVLIGPTGAITLTLVQQLLIEFLLQRKPIDRAIFNLSQLVVATAAAGAVYQFGGGVPSLEALPFRESFGPFLFAVCAYWLVNGAATSYALSLFDHRTPAEVWREITGNTILFDVVMSTLAYAIALTYVHYGPISLLAALVPMTGLRYSYGINIELQQLNQDLLRVLIKTLEARDAYTSGHSTRVAERSRKVAIQMGVRGKQLRLIETAALLHDIGKVDVAYAELLKQDGPLTPEQFELIRAHPDKGVGIMEAVRSLDPMILACIRHHHERFDGSGYPAGLAGDDIPLGARIITIGDSMDAMMTDRPYRKALTIEEVRVELIEGKGTQFDPDVVDAALASGILEDAASQAGSPAEAVDERVEDEREVGADGLAYVTP